MFIVQIINDLFYRYVDTCHCQKSVVLLFSDFFINTLENVIFNTLENMIWFHSFRWRHPHHGEPVYTKLCKNWRRQNGVQCSDYIQVDEFHINFPHFNAFYGAGKNGAMIGWPIHTSWARPTWKVCYWFDPIDTSSLRGIWDLSKSKQLQLCGRSDKVLDNDGCRKGLDARHLLQVCIVTVGSKVLTISYQEWEGIVKTLL